MKNGCRTVRWAILVVLSVTGRAPADWPQWRGPEQTGAAVESPPLIDTLPADGLRPLWTSEPIKAARNGGWGSPSIADGRVYLFAHEREDIEKLGPAKFPWLAEDKRGHLTAEQYAEYERNRRDEDQERAKASVFRELVYCLDAATGATIWHTRSDSVYSRFPQSGSPTVVGSKVYILGAARIARCLDAATGKDLWSQKLPGDFRDEFYQSSVLVIGDVAVVVAGHLFGLNAATGEIVWQGSLRRDRRSSSISAAATLRASTRPTATNCGASRPRGASPRRSSSATGLSPTAAAGRRGSAASR
jgi:outer membrane protein assembly factor BamB